MKNNERAFKSFCSQNLQSHISKSNIYSLLLCKIAPLTAVVCTSVHTNVGMPGIISNSCGHFIWNQVMVCHALLLFREVSRVPDTRYWSHMLYWTVLRMSTACSASFPHSLFLWLQYFTKLPEACIRERSPLELHSDKDNCFPSLSSAEAQRKLPLHWIWSTLIPSILC